MILSLGDERRKMDDTISRQAAIDAANDWLLDCFKVQKQDRSCGLIRRLENLPSTQPEIVYCKDCICGHGEVWLSWNGSADFYRYCGRTQLRVLPYDYCSYAKRRTNESDRCGYTN